MFTPTKEEIFADLKWKAELLHSRGYYLDKTVLQLMEYLCEHGETPYQWKPEVKAKKNKNKRGGIDEKHESLDTSELPDQPNDD